MADHDEILRRQRERMQEHRAWLAEQQDALRDMGNAPGAAAAAGGSAAGRSPTSPQRGMPAADAADDGVYAVAASGRRYGMPQDYEPGMETQDSRMLSVRSSGSPLNVHARSTQWARRRAQKLDELKEVRDSETHEDCPFTPEVHDYVSPSSRRASRDKVRGMGTYLQRQERARQLKEEKILKIKCDGSNWTASVTVPEEFNLGSRNRRTNLSALNQPLRAPSSRTPVQLHHMLHDPTAVAEEADGAAEAVAPRGAFSAKTSTAIIDIAAQRSVSS